MYYDNNILNVIVSIWDIYDYRYIPNETELKFLNQNQIFSKQ